MGYDDWLAERIDEYMEDEPEDCEDYVDEEDLMYEKELAEQEKFNEFLSTL